MHDMLLGLATVVSWTGFSSVKRTGSCHVGSSATTLGFEVTIFLCSEHLTCAVAV